MKKHKLCKSERLNKPDIWINGDFIPWDRACFHPFCHSFQRGATLFESIDCTKAANGKAVIFRLPDHMIRFQNSARLIGMPLPYTLDELMKAVCDTVARSGMKICTIRPLAFYSDPVFDVYPGDSQVTVAIGLGDKKPVKESIKVKISGFRKIESTSMPIKAKVSGNYIAPMIAKSEAIHEGFDDTILLDSNGFVAEGASSNVFMVENGSIITSPGNKILQGITRDSIMVLSTKLGIPVKEEVFTADRLKSADEVFMSSSGMGVTPVIQVDDTLINSGKPGQFSNRLRAYYIDVTTGKEPEFENWLTYID